MVECPRAFLFRAARNLALNHIRHARVRLADAARAVSDETLKQHVPTAEEEMISSEEAAACRRLLEELPQRCREAFVLRVVEDLSYKQMSKSMRLSVSTLEKHIGKGKQICRTLLTDPASNDPSLEVLASRLPPEQQAARRRARSALSLAAE
jgi:RNA polymerase sigma-70 factor (ECF subfamily)